MEYDKQLTPGNQHVAHSPEPETALIVPASLPAATQDEAELEERHGGQYHLRHQLSGCAQTLHVIDFQQDFSLSEPEHIFVAPAQQDSPHPLLSPPFSGHAEQIADLQSLHVNTFVNPVIEQASLPSAVNEKTHSPAASVVLPHTVTHAFSSAASASIAPYFTPEETERMPITAELQPASARYHTDVNEMALGDWLLGVGSQAEQKLENGRLHFLADELEANQILLQQRFVLPESTHFQFEMMVNISEGSELPSFNMLINDVSVPMEAYPMGNAVMLRSEFMMPANEPISLAILPAHSLSPGASLWIDHLQLQPWQPDVSQYERVNDASFENVHTEIALFVPEKHPGIAQILVSDAPDLFPPVQSDVPGVFGSVTLESVIGEGSLTQWNTASTVDAPMPGIQLETQPVPVADIINESVFDT